MLNINVKLEELGVVKTKPKIKLSDIWSAIKNIPKKHWFIAGSAYALIFAIGFYVFVVKAEAATNVSGNISVDTTWDVAGSPYVLTGNVTITDGATLTIDQGVTVQSSAAWWLYVSNGVLDINGAAGSPVIFTHQSATVPNSWKGIEVQSTGSATIDYSEFYYADVGIRANGGTLTINDSLFSTNRVGVAGYNQATITTARSTFIKNEYFGLGLNPDVTSVTLGSGADEDVLGTDVNKNGFDAIGLGYPQANTSDCPLNICTLSPTAFAGHANMPYLVYQDYFVEGSGDTLVVAAGAIVKLNRQNFWGRSLYIRNGAQIDINGTTGNEVIFTSYKDDSIGGDTNNDGVSSGSAGDWGRLNLASGTNTIDFAKFYYGGDQDQNTSLEAAVHLYTNGSSLGVSDSVFESNQGGLSCYNQVSLTTARNVFNKNAHIPIALNYDVSSISLGSGADADLLGTSTNKNGYNAIGLAYGVNTDDCPGDVCVVPSRTFAGISNIPWRQISG